MNNKNSYDFIIAGVGLAGLSLAMQLKNANVNFTKVLLIDKDLKNKNDRTWCFWSKEKDNWFDKVIFKRWSKFKFSSSGLNKVCEINPYQYCMIKGIDFYNFCINELKSDKRFEFVTDEIKKIETKNNLACLHTSTNEYQANYLFNSAFRTPKKEKNHINYVQHFKGWLIETEEKKFDVDCPTFMDFNIHQKNDCRFVYVLPFSANKALIEYTGFSSQRIDDKE
ncbi:MAG: lycopene cyclase, partial [Bacteroidia bacterium]|nr:lycopene cyclase [Bacteroidia bacterium]